LVQSNDHIGDNMVQLNDYILNHIARAPTIPSKYNKEKKFDYINIEENGTNYI
jgi:hypothetical protein